MQDKELDLETKNKIEKYVERSKDKTPVVRSLLKEITTNKKMYQYRQDPKTKIKKRKLAFKSANFLLI